MQREMTPFSDGSGDRPFDDLVFEAGNTSIGQDNSSTRMLIRAVFEGAVLLVAMAATEVMFFGTGTILRSAFILSGSSSFSCQFSMGCTPASSRPAWHP